MRIVLSVMMAVILLACEEKESDFDTSLVGDEANGEILFDGNCAGCHGAAADGGSGPSLLGEDDDDFAEAIQYGEGSMPAFPDFTDQDIADVIAFVRTLE